MIQLGTYPQIQYLPICTECGKKITKEVKLIKRIGRVWGIEPEVCPECGAKFTGVTVYHPTIETAKEG